MSGKEKNSLADLVRAEFDETSNIENSRKRTLAEINKYIENKDFSKVQDLEQLLKYKKLFKKASNGKSLSRAEQKSDINSLQKVRDELENNFSKNNFSLLIKIMKDLQRPSDVAPYTSDASKSKKSKISLKDPQLEEAVNAEDVLLVRTIILNHIDIDVNRKFFFSEQIIPEIEPELSKRGLSLFEEDDGDFKLPSEADWDKKLWQRLKVEMRYNFSRNKFDQVIRIMKFLRGKDDSFKPKVTNFTKV